VESLGFHAVADSIQLLVFGLNLCDDGALVCFELTVLLVVAVVLLDFSKGG